MAKWAGFSDEQSRQLDALVTGFRAELARVTAPDRVLDRRGSGTAIRPRPGDVIRAQAGDVVVLPHPRSAKGREPVVVLVESQPVSVLAESGTVNDVARVVVTVVGAMEWWSTGTEWWGSAVGGSGGAGGTPGVIPDQTVLGNDSGADAVATPITVHQELDWLTSGVFWVFDGVDDRVSFGDFNDIERTDSVTVSAWIQTPSVAAQQAIVSKLEAGPGFRGWEMGVEAPGKLYFLLSTNLAGSEIINAQSPNDSVPTGALTHVAITYPGTGLASGVLLYINGVLVATTAVAPDVAAGTSVNAQPLVIGRRDVLGNIPFSGILRDVAIFTSVLTGAQVTNDLYNGGTPPDLTALSPVFWVKFDASDTTGAGGILDYGTGNHDGTAAGGLGSVSTVGAIPVRSTAIWQALPPGTVDLPLVSNGPGLVPAYERLANAGLATAAANTYKGNATGSVASVTDNAISGLAGAGMTASGSVLNVIGSTSITVNADSVERPALTGAITAPANSNVTAFGSAAAKSVLANATNGAAVPAFLAGTGAFQHLRVNSTNTGLEWAVLSLAAFPTMAAGSFLANVTAGAAVPTAHDLATFAGAGLTYTNVTGVLAVGAGTHIVANANDITLDLTTLVAAIDSTSIASTGTTLVREALTGEVTAATNSNATTVTRSTNFASSPWTGAHTWNGAGNWTVNITGDANITATIVGLDSDTTMGLHADNDMTLSSDEDVHVACDTLRVKSNSGSGVAGFIIIDCVTASTPTMATGEGMYWGLDDGAVETVPVWTSDSDVDYRIKLTGANTIISVSGTVNNAAITNTTSAIQCTAATTINGIAPGYHGQALDIFTSGNNNLTVNHASGSATGSPLALRGSAAYGPLARGGMRVIYDEPDVVWREVARA
jgi:hypothetical protein